MPEPKLELMCAQVEVALEEGDLQAARRMLDQALAHYPEAPELRRLGAQLAEVSQLAGRSTLEGLMESAQERVRAADYPAALELLRRAVSLAPENQDIRATLERTEKAAERHALALERQQKMAAAANEVSLLLDAGDLQTARARLQTARGEFGRQKPYDDLEARLHRLVEEAQAKSAEQHLERARVAAARQDWHGALNQAELALTLAPGHVEAAQLRRQAREQLEAAASADQRRSSLQEARDDIERLIGAGELARADESLQQAIDKLGREPLFVELAESIDKAKKDLDFKRRFEWRERRAKEAEALIAEGTRRALGGDFETAVAKLEAARELDPTHPDLEEKLATHRSALVRQQMEGEQAAEIDGLLATIRSHLEALRLDDAATLIATVRRKAGDDMRLTRLEQRLAGLREAEDQAQVLPTPENLESLGLAARAAIEKHERAVAAAYSWQQALAFPFRGGGPLIFLLLAAAFTATHAAALSLGLPDLLWPILVAAVAPGLVRGSLEGKNQPPTPMALLRAATARDVIATLLVLGVAGVLPSAFVLTRALHGLFELAPLGFFVLALLIWGAAWWTSAALGVALAFGPRRLFAVHRLARPGASLLAVSAMAFVVVASALWIRIAVVPVMAVPLAALIAAFGLLAVPHLIGVMVRSRRLKWAASYVS